MTIVTGRPIIIAIIIRGFCLVYLLPNISYTILLLTYIIGTAGYTVYVGNIEELHGPAVPYASHRKIKIIYLQLPKSHVVGASE